MPHVVPLVPVWVETVLILSMVLLVHLFMWKILTFCNKRKNTGNQESVNDKLERDLRDAAQQALDAIGSKLRLTDKRSDGSKHVFNNGLLKIHRNVLEDLLKDVGGFDEQMENLMNDLVFPLSPTHRDAISTMVVNFRLDEFYVDFNADVYGEYAKELRELLVAFLKAHTSDNSNEKKGIPNLHQEVEILTSRIVNYEVYVDPLARDRWLQENQKVKDRKLYNEVRDALKKMFQNIRQNFQNVSVKIRDFRSTNNWNR